MVRRIFILIFFASAYLNAYHIFRLQNCTNHRIYIRTANPNSSIHNLEITECGTFKTNQNFILIGWIFPHDDMQPPAQLAMFENAFYTIAEEVYDEHETLVAQIHLNSIHTSCALPPSSSTIELDTNKVC